MARATSLVFAVFVSSLLVFSTGVLGDGPGDAPIDTTDINGTLIEEIERQVFAVGYVVVNDHDLAQQIGNTLLSNKMVASVNLLPGVQSLSPASPVSEGSGSMIVFITRVVNIQFVKVLVESQMFTANQELPYYQIFFTVLADVNAEYLQFIQTNTVDASVVVNQSKLITKTATTNTSTSKQASTENQASTITAYTFPTKQGSTITGNTYTTKQGSSTQIVFPSPKPLTKPFIPPTEPAFPSDVPLPVETGSEVPIPAETLVAPEDDLTIPPMPPMETMKHKVTHKSTTTSLRRRLANTSAESINIVDLSEFSGDKFRVFVKKNQPLALQVKTNSGTGYTWNLCKEQTSYEDVSDPIEVENQDVFPGAPHLTHFRVQPTVAGIVVLELLSPVQEVARHLTVSIIVA